MHLLKKVGLVGLGLVAGVSISLHFAAIADKETLATPLPVEELRAFTEVFGHIKSNYVEPVTDKKTFRRRYQRNVKWPGSSLCLPG